MPISHSPPHFWNHPLPATPTENSPYDKMARNMGLILKKEVTLAQGSEPIHKNLFTFTGPFRILQLYGVCTRVGAGGSADCDDCWWNVYDGTNTVALSLGGSNNGRNISNITVHSVIFRNDASTVVMGYAKADQVRVKDAAYAGSEIWMGSLITPSTGLTNYIRFTYDTAAASGIDFDIEFFLLYSELDYETSSGLAAV